MAPEDNNTPQQEQSPTPVAPEQQPQPAAADPYTPPADPATPPSEKKPSGKRHLLFGILVLVVAAIVSVVLYMVNPGGIFDSTPDIAYVSITDEGFVPETLKVAPGQQVQWINEDTTSHQVASDPYPDHSDLPSLFAERPITQNGRYFYTFEDGGEYTYTDQLNPAKYHGTVIVE